MAPQYNADFYKHAQSTLDAIKKIPALPAHDVQGRRDRVKAQLAALHDSPDQKDPTPTVHERDYTFTSYDGHTITISHRYVDDPDPDRPGPAILHVHGGAMIFREVAPMKNSTLEKIRLTSIPFFTVDYRVAPEVRAPTPVEDVYAGLQWLHAHAAELGVDAARIAVMGESAGGGIAAGVALLARDRGLVPRLAKQVLVCPMLDDRTVEDAALAGTAFHTYEDNVTGWAALLGDEYGTERVSMYAAPARVESVKGLPPTYIDTGGLDIFRDEDMKYAMRLAGENIDVEFHLYPGVPHAFETLAPQCEMRRVAVENRVRAMKSF